MTMSQWWAVYLGAPFAPSRALCRNNVCKAWEMMSWVQQVFFFSHLHILKNFLLSHFLSCYLTYGENEVLWQELVSRHLPANLIAKTNSHSTHLRRKRMLIFLVRRLSFEKCCNMRVHALILVKGKLVLSNAIDKKCKVSCNATVLLVTLRSRWLSLACPRNIWQTYERIPLDENESFITFVSCQMILWTIAVWESWIACSTCFFFFLLWCVAWPRKITIFLYLVLKYLVIGKKIRKELEHYGKETKKKKKKNTRAECF